MWMWTLDDRLINMDLVESLELVDCYPEDADTNDIDAGTTEPDFFELVARMASGDETLLFESDNSEEAFMAYDLLASVLADPRAYGDDGVQEPFSVYHLLESSKQISND